MNSHIGIFCLKLNWWFSRLLCKANIRRKIIKRHKYQCNTKQKKSKKLHIFEIIRSTMSYQNDCIWMHAVRNIFLCVTLSCLIQLNEVQQSNCLLQITSKLIMNLYSETFFRHSLIHFGIMFVLYPPPPPLAVFYSCTRSSINNPTTLLTIKLEYFL